MSDKTTNAIAIHEKAVWSVARPTARNASPIIKKMDDEFLRFMSGIIHFNIIISP